MRDHQRIVHLMACYEFPWELTRSLELALFRTYGVPSISTLLDSTGEFALRAQLRYDDTDILVSTLLEDGYDSETGRRALRRMNQLHGRFRIQNDDYRYVLSTFVLEPVRFNARFGWRPMIEQERLALFHHWRAIGERMGIVEIPDTHAELEAMSLAYERDHYRFHEANRRVGSATRDLFAAWFPRPARPLVRCAIHALIDDSLRKACGFPRPLPGTRRALTAALGARAFALRWLWPRRATARRRTALPHRARTTPFALEHLGPPSTPPGERAVR